MLKRSFSFTSTGKETIGRGIQLTREALFNFLVDTARATSNMLSSTKGRKKICSLIQYIAKFRYYCNIHSNIAEIAAKYTSSSDKNDLLSGRIMKEMSKNKKIFKLFKFVDAFVAIQELGKKQHSFN